MKKIICIALALVMLLSCVTLLASCGREKNGVKVIDIALSVEEYAFAVKKDDATLLGQINAYLAQIKADGTFDEICNKYFGDGTPTKFESAALDSGKDQLVVATSTGFAPFEMVENGQYYGIDLEIAKGFAEYLGKELVIQDMKFESVVTSVQMGTCDIGMAGLTVTPARQQQVTFSNSYYNASQVLIVNENDTTFDACTTADEIVAILDTLTTDTKIGCQTGTTGETYLVGDLDNPDGYGFKGVPATKMGYDYAALAVTAMRNGEINFVILDNAPANTIAASVNK